MLEGSWARQPASARPSCEHAKDWTGSIDRRMHTCAHSPTRSGERIATAKKSAKKAAKRTTPRVKQDRRQVSGAQADEVAFESKKMGASPEALKKAIAHVANVRRIIRSRLAQVRAKKAK
jgi:hypothetical protein